MLKGLERLINKKIKDVQLLDGCGDLLISFGNLYLKVFCNFTGNEDNEYRIGYFVGLSQEKIIYAKVQYRPDIGLSYVPILLLNKLMNNGSYAETSKETFCAAFGEIKNQFKSFEDSMSSVLTPFFSGIDVYRRE